MLFYTKYVALVVSILYLVQKIFVSTEDIVLVVFIWYLLKLTMFKDKFSLCQCRRPDQIGATSASPSTHEILTIALKFGKAQNLDSFAIRYGLCAFKFILVYEEVDLEILLMCTLRDLEDQCFDFSPAEAIKIKSSIDLENKIRAACDFASSIS
jgi:hypothetical protein